MPTQIDSEIPGCTSPHEGNDVPSYTDRVSSHAKESSQPDDSVAVGQYVDEGERYNQDIQQTPLTALDSNSTIGNTQEVALLVELGNQLPKHSPVVHQSISNSLPNVATTQDTISPETLVQEIDGRLNKELIDEINMQDAGELDDVASHTSEPTEIHTNNVTEEVGACDESPDTTLVKADQAMQPSTVDLKESKTESSIETTVPTTAHSFFVQRQLVHIHTLKQIVASNESLTNMAFEEADYQQAAKIYENLNSTAGFYTTALRLLSKADWNERVSFEDRIVHQAMIAVARGWTTAVSIKNHDFGHFHLALAMSTLPTHVHGDLKLAFDSIVMTIPSPFREKASSKVSCSCRVCGKSASYDVPTFVILHALSPTALGHDYFNASVPWTEKLLQGSSEDVLSNCHDCASSSSWTIEMLAACRLVWLQYPRELHPQAIQYPKLLGKDPFFAGGGSWQCISLVIHQGNDPLYGDHQPAEHFYVLESEGPRGKSFCYNNAFGLHYIDDAKIKEGDRICGHLYRTTNITTKWSGQCTYTTKKAKTSSPQKLEKSKRNRSNRGPRILLCSRKRGTPKKLPLQNPVTSRMQRVQEFSVPERYEPSPEDATTIPVETIQIIEDAISQSQGATETALTFQQEGGDPSHRPSLSLQASQAQNASSGPARHGPYSAGGNDNMSANSKAKSASKSPVATAAQNPPYAILSMFDGCGSSVDIIEAKFGYRLKVCVLCEKDETLRYLVAEKYGISVDHKWQHSSKGGGAFYYATSFLLTMQDCFGSLLR